MCGVHNVKSGPPSIGPCLMKIYFLNVPTAKEAASNSSLNAPTKRKCVIILLVEFYSRHLQIQPVANDDGRTELGLTPLFHLGFYTRLMWFFLNFSSIRLRYYSWPSSLYYLGVTTEKNLTLQTLFYIGGRFFVLPTKRNSSKSGGV